MTKKLIAFLVLCIALSGLSAAADGTGAVVTDFEDFTLRTDTALALLNEKAHGQALFLFYPCTEAGISMAAVNAVWSRDTDPLTAEAFSQLYRDAEADFRSQYESGGLLLTGYESGKAQEKACWDKTALFCDATLLIGINETETVLYQRGIRITGEFGTYTFSLSAWSPELLEEATEYLIRALAWK